MYYLYIIRCKTTNKFYTGITDDIVRRLREHDYLGKGSVKYTKKLGPFKLVHLEECSDRVSARLREKYWKSGIGREVRDKFFC